MHPVYQETERLRLHQVLSFSRERLGKEVEGIEEIMGVEVGDGDKGEDEDKTVEAVDHALQRRLGHLRRHQVLNRSRKRLGKEVEVIQEITGLEVEVTREMAHLRLLQDIHLSQGRRSEGKGVEETTMGGVENKSEDQAVDAVIQGRRRSTWTITFTGAEAEVANGDKDKDRTIGAVEPGSPAMSLSILGS